MTELLSCLKINSCDICPRRRLFAQQSGAISRQGDDPGSTGAHPGEGSLLPLGPWVATMEEMTMVVVGSGQ